MPPKAGSKAYLKYKIRKLHKEGYRGKQLFAIAKSYEHKAKRKKKKK